MKIAIATSDNINVNEHFGKAKRFSIYNVDSTGCNLITDKEVTPYSSGQIDHSFDEARFNEIARAISGSKKVYISRIGNEPAEALKALGIEPVVFTGAIKDINVSQ